MSESNIHIDQSPPTSQLQSSQSHKLATTPTRLSYAAMSKPPDNEHDIDYGSTYGFQPIQKPIQSDMTMSRRTSRIADVKLDGTMSRRSSAIVETKLDGAMSRRTSLITDAKAAATMPRHVSGVVPDTAQMTMTLPTINKR